MEKYIGKYSVKDFLYLILGAFIYSIGTHSFIETANIAPGGAVGVALMLNHVTNLPVGRLTLMVNVPLLILAWFHLSRAFALRTAFACGICSVVLDYVIAPVFPVYMATSLWEVSTAAFWSRRHGVHLSVRFDDGRQRCGRLPAPEEISACPDRARLMMIDGIILSTSIFVFGNVDAALFGLISLYAQTKVIDMIIYGNDAGSEASIVTKYPQKIAERVIKEIDRTVTLLPGKGGYSGEDTTVVLCTVRKTEFNRLKRIIAETDENAFVIVKETSGIFGLGFKDVAEAQQ